MRIIGLSYQGDIPTESRSPQTQRPVPPAQPQQHGPNTAELVICDYTIEGLNGYAKDTAHQALAQPGRRRVRGIAAQSLFTALLLTAANIRKIRAWRARTTSGTTTARRERRRRASLSDYLPDG